jgi:hypothetical protein
VPAAAAASPNLIDRSARNAVAGFPGDHLLAKQARLRGHTPPTSSPPFPRIAFRHSATDAGMRSMGFVPAAA